ncbi:hypothetical protein F2Q70_00001966 [Brassica cretica]|uniref:Uncharacterized protein n=1 Tax=Brassica cretica TaxID=69181 RepID=A0A8S9ITF4_BRACR|nr:hypothetical protein F2Q70_00001966 [Brassica cretica]
MMPAHEFRVSCAAEREAHSDCWLNLVIPSGRVSAFSRDEILSLGGCQGIAIPRKHHSPPRLTYPIRLRLCRVLSSRHHVGDFKYVWCDGKWIGLSLLNPKFDSVIPSGRVSAFSRDEILSHGGCQGIAIPRKHHSPPRLTYPIRLRLCRVLSSRHHVGHCALLIRA